MRLQVQIWLKGTLKKDCERSCKITAVIWYSNMLFGSQSAKFSMTKTETLLEKAIWSNAPSKRICPLHGWIENSYPTQLYKILVSFVLDMICSMQPVLWLSAWQKHLLHVMWADWRGFFFQVILNCLCTQNHNNAFS